MKTTKHIFSILGCGASKPTVDPYVGVWNLVIAGTPQGDIKAEMSINMTEDKGYNGQVKSDVGAFKLNNLSIKDSKLAADFEVQGMDLDLNGIFSGPDFKGFVTGDGFTFDANGTKIQQ